MHCEEAAAGAVVIRHGLEGATESERITLATSRALAVSLGQAPLHEGVIVMQPLLDDETQGEEDPVVVRVKRARVRRGARAARRDEVRVPLGDLDEGAQQGVFVGGVGGVAL